ncbi:C-C chemokine receptor type 8-like [Palaemon carinicauda]|uniref:C-C chemokine receptor type 8-like n=1 Tax=Palaemon carinicauda TaxID=392227 RepID=UPI0035B5EECA
MIVVNCTVDDQISGWVMVAVWEQLTICLIGSICSAVSIWCLVGCQRTGRAVKIQLICTFGLQICICVVTLPFVTYLYYTHFFCLGNIVPKQLAFFFSILNSILLQGERLNFMVMAVYRVLAVLCPQQYQKLATMNVAISLQVGIFLIIIPPWIVLCIVKNFDFSDESGNVMRLHFEQKGSSNFIMALYGVNYILPFIITFIAYTLMIISVVRQNHFVRTHARRRTKTMDHVASTIRFVILTNILLDGPHVVFHLLEGFDLATIVTHMAFFLHLVLDPVIFIGMNQNYRREVRKLFWGCFPKRVESFGRPHCLSDVSGEVGKSPGLTQGKAIYTDRQTGEVEDKNDPQIRETWRQVQFLATDKRNAVYIV